MWPVGRHGTFDAFFAYFTGQKSSILFRCISQIRFQMFRCKQFTVYNKLKINLIFSICSTILGYPNFFHNPTKSKSGIFIFWSFRIFWSISSVSGTFDTGAYASYARRRKPYHSVSKRPLRHLSRSNSCRKFHVALIFKFWFCERVNLRPSQLWLSV